jgi:hypothetical protein
MQCGSLRLNSCNFLFPCSKISMHHMYPLSIRLLPQSVAKQLSGVAAEDLDEWYEACRGVIDLVAPVNAPGEGSASMEDAARLLNSSPGGRSGGNGGGNGDANHGGPLSVTDEMRALQVSAKQFRVFISTSGAQLGHH